MKNYVSVIRQIIGKSIQIRLTLYFLLILIPLVAVSLLGNYRSQAILDQEVGERAQSALLSSIEYIDLIVQNLDELSAIISTEQSFIDTLRDVNQNLTSQNIYDFRTMLQSISAMTAVNHSIVQTNIFHGYTGTMISNPNGISKLENYEQEEWFKQAIRANGRSIIYLPPSANNYDKEQLDSTWNPDNLYIIRLMDLYSFQRDPNLVIISIKKETLLNIIRHLAPSKRTNVYLMKDDQLVVSTLPGQVGVPVWLGGEKNISVQNNMNTKEKTIMIRASSKVSGWSIIQEQPEKEIRGPIQQIQKFTYLIIAISVLLALWISLIVYGSISIPLKKLAAAMKQFSLGNLTVRLQHKQSDEFGYLMNSFNKMTSEHKRLIEDGYEKQLGLVKAEFRLLQSQINPHFLYNTLDCIYTVAVEHEVEEISEMVLHLSQFFRVSLGKGRDKYTLAETVDHLMHYIKVQKIRLMHHFSVHVYLAEASKSVPLLKLLLQPLVENAIVHGLEKRSAGNGMLFIRSEIDGDMLIIRVEDNGVGIQEDRLNYIHNVLSEIQLNNFHNIQLNKEPVPTGNLFGLVNVKSRLKLYYGELADLIIESEPNKGTVSTVRIPLNHDRKDNIDETIDR